MGVLKKIPDAESGSRVTCVDVNAQTWVITQNPTAPASRRFTLYKAVEDGFESVGTAESPLDLYPRIDFGPEAAAHAAPEPEPEPKPATRRARPRARKKTDDAPQT